MKKKIDVVLLGHRFTVRSDKDERYVQSLVQLVQKNLEEMRQVARGASEKEVALLCALNFADALVEEQEAGRSTRSKVRAKTEAMAARLRGLLHDDRVADGAADDADVHEADVVLSRARS